jgi:hypothetical protein
MLLELGVALQGDLGLLGARHALQHRVRQALTGEEEQADPDADGHLDRLEADPEGKAARVGDAVRDEG